MLSLTQSLTVRLPFGPDAHMGGPMLKARFTAPCTLSKFET